MQDDLDEGHKVRSPDQLQLDEASGIEALPTRAERYGKAKKRALEVLEYAKSAVDRGQHFDIPLKRLELCGEYLVFHHYPAVNQVRLHAARFCKMHILCPLCAIRRGSKALGAYLPKYEALRASRPLLRPFLVTFTVKDGSDLVERFKHLQQSMHELWKRRFRSRGSVLELVEGAVWSYEVKKGRNSGLWHPHAHMVAMAPAAPCSVRLAQEWLDITGDSFMVDVRPIDIDDPAGGFMEVFKYALKFSDMDEADTVEAYRSLRKRRLVASAGAFRGIEIPDQLTDEPLDDLPFVEYFFRYFDGGYGLDRGRGTRPDNF
jgi:hypothetical protein